MTFPTRIGWSRPLLALAHRFPSFLFHWVISVPFSFLSKPISHGDSYLMLPSIPSLMMLASFPSLSQSSMIALFPMLPDLPPFQLPCSPLSWMGHLSFVSHSEAGLADKWPSARLANCSCSAAHDCEPLGSPSLAALANFPILG